MTAVTLRLPDALQAEATAYAARLGVSLNALCAFALRDYLDARLPLAALHQGAVLPAVASGVTRLHGTKAAAVIGVSLTSPSTQSDSEVASWPKVGANQPCPCGSGRKYKLCHGKPGA